MHLYNLHRLSNLHCKYSQQGCTPQIFRSVKSRGIVHTYFCFYRRSYTWLLCCNQHHFYSLVLCHLGYRMLEVLKTPQRSSPKVLNKRLLVAVIVYQSIAYCPPGTKTVPNDPKNINLTIVRGHFFYDLIIALAYLKIEREVKFTLFALFL